MEYHSKQTTLPGVFKVEWGNNYKFDEKITRNSYQIE